jgi:hypothetical protein
MKQQMLNHHFFGLELGKEQQMPSTISLVVELVVVQMLMRQISLIPVVWCNKCL